MASDDSGSGFVFYHYDPSAAAAIIFIVVFAILTIIHVYQLVRTRTWFFIAFAVGGVFEAVGYVGVRIRSGSSRHAEYYANLEIANIISQRIPRLHRGSLHYPVDLTTRRPCLLRGFHLHDSWSYHPSH